MGKARPRTARNRDDASAAIAPASAFSLLPYQRRFVDDRSRFVIALMARQTGKSTAVAAAVNASILDCEADGQRELHVLLSRGERQSREAARKVYQFAEMMMRARSILQGVTLVDLEGSASELRYPGGSRVVALPANPDTARGYSGHVWLDEFAFHADSDAIWTALYPTITRGYRVRVLSTPNGQGNRFYQLWSEAASGAGAWSAHRVTIHDAIRDGLPVDADELRRGLGDELAWRQEFECEFLDEASAWLPWELIRGCEDPRAAMRTEARGGCEQAAYAGWDVARHTHLSVLWVVEQVGDVCWTRDVHVMRGMRFADQIAEVAAILGAYPRMARLCVDAGGMGEMVTEDIQRRVRCSVEGVKFTAGLKEVLAGDLRRQMEDRRLRLPVDDGVRDDLHSVRRTMTAAGNARFEGEGDGHADRFWALTLAVHAGQRPTTPFRFIAGDRLAAAGIGAPAGADWAGL